MAATCMDTHRLSRAGLTEAMFLGVVRAIAKEVAASQDMHTDDLIGMSYEYCYSALLRFEPARMSGLGNKAFARFAFSQVKPSMVRDITRERRHRAGFVSNGDLPKMRVWVDPSIVECDKGKELAAETAILRAIENADPITKTAIGLIVSGETAETVARRFGFDSVDELTAMLEPVREIVIRALEEKHGGHSEDGGASGDGTEAAPGPSGQDRDGGGGLTLFDGIDWTDDES